MGQSALHLVCDTVYWEFRAHRDNIWTGASPAPDGGTVMTAWTPERVATVTRLWNEGLTTAEIGRAVGMSKNAVVGKAHRLQLPPRPSPIRRGKSYSRTPKAKNGVNGANGVHGTNGRKSATAQSGIVVPARSRAPEPPLAVGSSACKWPIGHPDEPASTSAASLRCSASLTAWSTTAGPTWPSGPAPTQPDSSPTGPRRRRRYDAGRSGSAEADSRSTSAFMRPCHISAHM